MGVARSALLCALKLLIFALLLCCIFSSLGSVAADLFFLPVFTEVSHLIWIEPVNVPPAVLQSFKVPSPDPVVNGALADSQHAGNLCRSKGAPLFFD
jgi:hypothetical protein